MKCKKSLILAICLVVCCFFGSQALAGSATVSWNANTESDLSYYKVYYGTSPRSSSCTSGCYSSSLNVGNVTSYTFSNLTNGSTYYFAVTAVDTGGLESGYSEEKSKVITATIRGDLNNDTVVDISDIGIMVSNWNSTARPAADINQDGIVDISDIGILVANWS